MISIRRHRRAARLAGKPPVSLAASALAALLAGCAAEPALEPMPTEPSTGPSAGRSLPAGPGRAILERDCTGCHDLDGLWAYRGYYDEARWRAMIVTMADHGADLDEAEIGVLTRYLAEHFGPGTR